MHQEHAIQSSGLKGGKKDSSSEKITTYFVFAGIYVGFPSGVLDGQTVAFLEVLTGGKYACQLRAIDKMIKTNRTLKGLSVFHSTSV
jgi:hypothetical protein